MYNFNPWFKCYPSDFLDGLRDLDNDETMFYVHLVLRMYDLADAIRMDDKQIARMVGSNIRKWERVKASLIDKNKLWETPDGALINQRALKEMLNLVYSKSSTNTPVPDKIAERLTNVSLMFGQSFAKDCRNIPEKPFKNKGSKRDQKPDIRQNLKLLDLGEVPQEGTPERNLYDVAVDHESIRFWLSWFGPDRVTIIDGVVHPNSNYLSSRIEANFKHIVTAAGFTLGQPKEGAA